MKQGTFNKIFRIGNFIIKLSKEHSSVSKEIAMMGVNDIRKYENDIKATGVSTSNVYLHLKWKNKSLILQKYIDGYTLQEFFENMEINNVDKLKIFRELIVLYKKTLKNDDLCLDWNLKNFIISNREIIYIDYVPALYKSRIEQINFERLEQYKISYLDKQVQLAGIISYAITPFFNEDKSSLSDIYNSMVKCVEEILDIRFENVNLPNHVYIEKMKIISEYLNSYQTYEEFLKKYNSVTMESTVIKKNIMKLGRK